MPRSCGRASRDKIKPRPSRAPRETLESRPDSNNPADEAAASDRPRRAPRDHVVPGAGQGHGRTSAVPGLNFSLNRDENLLLADRGWQILGARARRSLAVDHITRVASDSHSQNLSGFDTENDLSLSGFTSPDTPLQEWSVLPSPRIILPSSVHSDRFLGDSRGQPFPEKEPATCANPVPPASRPSDLPKQDATQGGNVKEHQGENKSEATPSSKRPPPASPRCPRCITLQTRLEDLQRNCDGQQQADHMDLIREMQLGHNENVHVLQRRIQSLEAEIRALKHEAADVPVTSELQSQGGQVFAALQRLAANTAHEKNELELALKEAKTELKRERSARLLLSHNRPDEAAAVNSLLATISHMESSCLQMVRERADLLGAQDALKAENLALHQELAERKQAQERADQLALTQVRELSRLHLQFPPSESASCSDGGADDALQGCMSLKESGQSGQTEVNVFGAGGCGDEQDNVTEGEHDGEGLLAAAFDCYRSGHELASMASPGLSRPASGWSQLSLSLSPSPLPGISPTIKSEKLTWAAANMSPPPLSSDIPQSAETVNPTRCTVDTGGTANASRDRVGSGKKEARACSEGSSPKLVSPSQKDMYLRLQRLVAKHDHDDRRLAARSAVAGMQNAAMEINHPLGEDARGEDSLGQGEASSHATKLIVEF